MKIGIDISPIIYKTGVATYTENLVRSLLKVDEENDYLLFGGSLRRFNELKHESAVFVGHVKSKIYPIPPSLMSLLWNDLHTLPIEALTGRLDIFHSSDWTQPPSRAYKVTTIHDLVPLRFPEISHPKIVATHKKRLKWVEKEVDCIITISEFTKNELCELVGVSADKVKVIAEGPDPNIIEAPEGQVLKTKKRYGISGRYLLVVGTDPRKNVPRIVEAYKKIQKADRGLKLVILGRPRESMKPVDGVVVAGHVPRGELSAFYTGAEALVYCSVYEGFGLPILEAMQVGCPVVTSNITSMPEVAGEAAVLVDPYSSRDILHGMERALKNRKDLKEKGKKRAKLFSWSKTAKETLEVYKGRDR